MDILSPQTQRLLATPEAQAAIRRLLDGGSAVETVTLSDGHIIVLRRLRP